MVCKVILFWMITFVEKGGSGGIKVVTSGDISDMNSHSGGHKMFSGEIL